MATTFDVDETGTPVFVIGLTMAGAISAGAYTAGVVDYLMRAMHAHNARVGTDGGPRHKVMIKAISGASAGGMCAGLITTNLLAVGNDDEPDWDAPETFKYPGGPKGNLVLKRIFDAWVTNVKMWDARSKTGLLALDDFEKDRQSIDQAAIGMDAAGAISVLNSLHLDDVASTAVSNIPPWSSERSGLDFISSELDLFLTTTALTDIPYKVDFYGGDMPFVMEQHSVARHFRVNNLGSAIKLASPWLEDWGDEGLALSPREDIGASNLPLTSPDGGNWVKLTVASLATGAFPVGLAARVIDATPLELGALSEDGTAQSGAMPYDTPAKETVRPDFGTTALDAKTPYISVDGGVIDNEPFGYARYAIRQRDPDTEELLANPRTAKDAHRAVLMVDPFPEGAQFTPHSVPELFNMIGAIPVIGQTLGVFTGQARFKPGELVDAQDPEVRSRFLISPRREGDDEETLVGAKAIACGLLGGFGGFFDESFRLHDFVLGQRNCQKFLQEEFCLDASNPVLALPEGSYEEGSSVPIIDFGPDSPDEIPLHDWPQMSEKDLSDTLKQFDKRLDKLATGIIKQYLDGSLVVRTAWNKYLSPKINTLVETAIRKDLEARDQLAD